MKRFTMMKVNVNIVNVIIHRFDVMAFGII